MKITDAIAQADAFYPNSYTRDEKLSWCYEVTGTVQEKIRRLYNTIEYADGTTKMPDGTVVQGFVPLPPSVLVEDIEAVYVDGQLQKKVDDRSFGELGTQPGRARVVYKVRLEPYHENVFEGTYAVEDNRITAKDAWFDVGDLVRITHAGDVQERYVMEVDGDDYVFSEPFEYSGNVELKLEEVLTAQTPMPPPWDTMYIDYILGKVAYYQNDLDSYNKHMSEYNVKLSDYEKHYKQTNPIKAGLRFRSLW